MRRIAITLTVLALVAGSYACSSDAPTPPKSGGPTGPGPSGSSALQIRLFTSNANPPAGTCTLIQAVVTLNGTPVPDGTSVSFSTDFGVFAQNALPLISVVTQNGTAVTALCSEFPGTAVVRATATSGGESGSATISIQFQPAAAGAGPFVSFCDPSFGASTGGTALAIHGGRFCPTQGCTGNEAATTRVAFIVNGVLREATVVSVNGDTINVLTPGFPEVTSPTTPVEIRVTLNNNTAVPTVLALPNCFAFGTTLSTTPTITAVLPASGVNEGNTRVTILGSGFQAPLQVFFGEVEATIVSVAFNQIVVLTPAAFGSGRDNLNQQVDVRVRLGTSGLEAVLPGGYRYVQPLQITSVSNASQRVDRPFTPVTIFGHGFQSPVAVTLAGRPATIISVSESELVVLPSQPFLTGCADVAGPVQVTNINTGDTASGPTFTYLVTQTTPTIVSISPTTGPPGTVVTITGFNLPISEADADVRFGGRLAVVNSASSTQLEVVVPDQGLAAPLCPAGTPEGTLVNVGGAIAITVTNRLSTCTASLATAFQPQAACSLPTPTPGGPPPTFTPTVGPTPTPTPIPADLVLTKSDSPDPVFSGNTLTYTINVTNNGPAPALSAIVTDPLPADTTFISCTSSQGSCTGPSVGANGTVTANLGTIPFPGFATLSIAVNVTAPGGRTLTNSAVVRASSPDPNNANNTGTTSTGVSSSPSADLRIAKSDSPDPVNSGGVLTYTINVSNDSPITTPDITTANNVVVSDTLPAGTTFLSCTSTQGGACPTTVVGNSITMNLGSLPPTGIATVTVQVMVTAPAGSALANTATVSSSTPDPNPGNNSATATTSVTPGAATDLSIAKSDAPDPVFNGNNLTYTITVNNLGPNVANGAEVSDPLPGGTTFVSCVASQGTCTGPAVGSNGTVRALLGTVASAGSATVTIVVNVSAPGNSTLTNTATVLSATPDSSSANNTASATTSVSP
ncbi:MAG: IPT/TIG domain-containing protein [Acidobacteriota bacterium]|nr:IPT/TIG domain-containing protein [Acidobacteriota bacterium]MDQ5871667.1 IPT/TIG domain-containing protein [Acidobacteriota bacterium]